MIDLAIRVKNPVVWNLKSRNLGLQEEVVDTPAVLDEEGNEVTPAVMVWQWKQGVHVDQIETVWVTDPVYDEDGNEVQAGTAAQGEHYNIRIDNPAIEADWENLWDETYDQDGNLVSRSVPGAQAAQSNKSESTWMWQGIEIVDMTTVATPERVWL